MKRLFQLITFYLRLFFTLIWVVVASGLSLILGLASWKNVDNNRRFARFYGPFARAIMGIHLKVEGEEHIHHRPAIVVANHQSGLDLAIYSRLITSGAAVIGKKELRYIPLFGLIFEAFGNILIDRKDRSHSLGGLKSAVNMMKKRDLTIWIFPEGTRNASGRGLLPFKKGAFYMALQAGVPIIPVVCSSLEPLVHFGKKRARAGTLHLKVLPPISTQGRKLNDADTLMKEVREEMLRTLEDLNSRSSAP